jgi:CheY-like chemotaxis protein
MQYKEKTIEIVLLDDNPAIRIAMHILIEQIHPVDTRINIYTSQDGVQGLGYIAITNPQLIIIDATLPRYSGRELTEYLSSNPKYSNKDIIILSDGNYNIKEGKFPRNYHIVDKRDKHFADKLESKVREVLHITATNKNKLQRYHEKVVRAVIGGTIAIGNFSDKLIYYERRKGIIFKILFALPWFLSQVLGSMCLGLLRIMCGKTENANIAQKNKDDIIFRVKYYPTLIAVILTLLFLLIQLFAYLIGGLFILSQTGNVPVVTASCTPAYDNNYCYRKTITIDNTKVSGSTDLTNFPMLFSGTYSYLATTANSGMVENANGYDIIFTSDAAGSTKLSHEVESWSATTGAIKAWVKIPSLSATSDTTIYIFYGNGSISTSQEDVINVWDSNHKMVQHLKETSGTHYDSTSNDNDSTSITVTTQGNATGQINGADVFDGTDDYINIADSSSLDITNTGTLSVWISPDAVSASTSNFSSWTSLNAPDGNGYQDPAEVDTVLVGNKIYYAAYLHYGATDVFGVSNSNLDGSGQTSWTYLTAPDGAGEYEMSSVAVDSDGTKLYYAVLSNSDDVEAFATGYSNLDGSSFSGWTSRTAPNGTGINDRPSIAATIVGTKLYMAAYLHDNTTETFYTSSVNLDGTSFSGWTSRTAPDGAQHGSSVGLGLDSDGTKLYYAAYAGYTGSGATDPATEYFYTAYSDLDWGNFSSWTSQTAPDGTGAYDPGFIDMIIVGGRQYFAAYLHTDANKYFSTANATLDGSSMTSWTTQTAPSGATRNAEGTNTSIASDGKKLYYIAYSQYIETEALELATADVTNMPIISKSDAYELILSGSGIVLDWAGNPQRSFGALSASTLTHIAITLDGSNMKMYVNGVEKRNESTTVDFASNSSALKIGGNAAYFDGVVDEVRVSSSARSGDWIKTEYNNQIRFNIL